MERRLDDTMRLWGKEGDIFLRINKGEEGGEEGGEGGGEEEGDIFLRMNKGEEGGVGGLSLTGDILPFSNSIIEDSIILISVGYSMVHLILLIVRV